MITRIRDIRRGKGLTLADVAARCDPPTTPQTIGRLETGTRTVTVDWLNRIAAALDVLPADLVRWEDGAEMDVAARLTASGAEALSEGRSLAAPRPHGSYVGLLVEFPQGDYRPGDQLWLERLPPARFAEALGRDILAPRPAGRFAFGRLVGVEDQRLGLLPPQQGARQIVLPAVPWIAVARTLIRSL